MIPYYQNLNHAITHAKLTLKNEGTIQRSDRWQGMEVYGTEKDEMLEYMNFSFSSPIPFELSHLVRLTNPNLPWADEHFEERVGGKPTNPGDTYMKWPYYPKHDRQIRQEKFTHTYQERFWPKYAGIPRKKSTNELDGAPGKITESSIRGIWFEYGDLYDVVELLRKDPYTRQAYLPIWFPEDTGVIHGGRVPCTLGYLFSVRNGFMHITYYIRSCDALRHFNDDVYLACRLLHWMLDELQRTETGLNFWHLIMPGNLIMHINSFHCFAKERKVL